ncbi:MAG: hypothetical protein OEX01_08080 [Candidatus Bathyarchaeota archaeon]|nr:hypothetical protein [Candidatus Bathyarchaeota archaeon]
MVKLSKRKREDIKKIKLRKVSSSDVHGVRQSLHGRRVIRETAVPSKDVSAIRKGLVRTSDVSKYMKKIERSAAQKKKEIKL